MPKKYDRCVKKVKKSLKKYKRKGNPYAICKASMKKKQVLASNYNNAMKVARSEYDNVKKVKLVSNPKLSNKQYKVVAKPGTKLKKK